MAREEKASYSRSQRARETEPEGERDPNLKLFAVKNIDREKNGKPIYRIVTLHCRDSMPAGVKLRDDSSSIRIQLEGHASVMPEYIDAHEVDPMTRKKGQRKVLKTGTGRPSHVLVLSALSIGDAEYKYKKLCGIIAQSGLESGKDRFEITEINRDGSPKVEADEVLEPV